MRKDQPERPRGKFRSQSYFPKRTIPQPIVPVPGIKPQVPSPSSKRDSVPRPFSVPTFAKRFNPHVPAVYPRKQFSGVRKPAFAKPAFVRPEAKSVPSTTSWGGVPPWYDTMLEKGEGTYQKEVILPNLLRVMEPKAEEAIIDIACGQGYFSRVLAEAGAKVTGSDISPELIALAQKNVPKAVFHVSPAEKLAFASDGYFSKAVIVLAIQNIKGIEKAMKEAARVLKPDGKLFLVLNHPAFRVPQNSDWGFDEVKKIQFRRTDRYLSEIGVPIVMNPGQKESEKTVSFHRPLQAYFKELRKAGFAVTRLEEWISHKKSEKGPRQEAEDVARKEFPMFLFLEAVKLPQNAI